MSKIRKFYVKWNDKVWAILDYNSEKKEFALHIQKAPNMMQAPITIWAYSNAGIWDLGPERSLEWVRMRLIPPNRANIGEILAGFGMKEYDEFEMLYKLQGRCSQDDRYIEEFEDSSEI